MHSYLLLSSIFLICLLTPYSYVIQEVMFVPLKSHAFSTPRPTVLNVSSSLWLKSQNTADQSSVPCHVGLSVNYEGFRGLSCGYPERVRLKDRSRLE